MSLLSPTGGVFLMSEVPLYNTRRGPAFLPGPKPPPTPPHGSCAVVLGDKRFLMGEVPLYMQNQHLSNLNFAESKFDAASHKTVPTPNR